MLKTAKRSRVRTGARNVVAVFASLALALGMLPLAAIPQVAWADNEERASVEYWRIGEDSYYTIDPTFGGDQAYTDYRDEIEVHATLNRNLGADLYGNPKDVPYVRGQFKLRPQGGGEDIVVFDGSNTGSLGNDRITCGYVGSYETPGNSILGASFLLEAIPAGVYTLVMDLQFNTGNMGLEGFEDSWTPVQRFVTGDTLEVRHGDDPRPQVKRQQTKMVYSGQKYSDQLEATPSSPDNTIKWTCSRMGSSDPNAATDLDPYGLQLNEGGTITGKAVRVDYSQPFYFFATATEYDGDTVVGATSRKINMYITEQPGIDDVSVSFSRGAAGIIPGSKASVQMRLSSDSYSNNATILFNYTDAGGSAQKETASVNRSDLSGRVYTGDVEIPSDAVSIQSVTFDSTSVGAVSDKVYKLDAGEQAIAPGLALQVLDAEGYSVQLPEGTSSPRLRMQPQSGDAQYTWLDVDGYGYIDDAALYEFEPGAYQATLCAHLNGTEVELSEPVNVELMTGQVADLELTIGDFTFVEPTVTADGKQIGLGRNQAHVSCNIEWYADETCSSRIATADSRGWLSGNDTWVRAVPFGSSVLEYKPSAAVKVTTENADSIALDMPKRDTATVQGTVTGSDIVLSNLTATLQFESDNWYGSSSLASAVGADGAFALADVPIGEGLSAKLAISGAQINTETVNVDLVNAGSTVNAGSIPVSVRQGVILLQKSVDFATVTKNAGEDNETMLATTLSSDKQGIFLDDPSQVSAGDVLTCKLYKGSSSALYSGGVSKWCETTTQPLDANKQTAVVSQDMQATGSIRLEIDNPNSKVFIAALVKKDTGVIVSVDAGDSGDREGTIGTNSGRIVSAFSSVPADTYQVLLADCDAYDSIEPTKRLGVTQLKDALDGRGSDMYVLSGDIVVAAGKTKQVELAFPNSKPNAVPIDTNESGIQVTPFDSKLNYRTVIARGKADLPQDKDLNLVIKTTQSGAENSERLANIAGSVVYINGTAATAHEIIEGQGADESGDVYLMPNSIRNSTTANASNGLYVVSIPAADLASGKYGAFDADNPMTISFSAPRMNGSKISAVASVSFGNAAWSDYHVDAATIRDTLLRSTLYSIGSCEYANASLTCQVPDNVSTSSFTVNGIAPCSSDLEPGTSVDIYIDGVKSTSVTPNPGSGLYNAAITLNDPSEYSAHSISAKATLAGGEVVSSATSEVLFSSKMAALERIEVSAYYANWDRGVDYAGNWNDSSTSWLNGEAISGFWYYLPDTPVSYRLTFKKGEDPVDKGDVTDVYVNVPHGTDVWRLKASYNDSDGKWYTEPKKMGNTPPSGEWITYQPKAPEASITEPDAQKIESGIDELDAISGEFSAKGQTVTDADGATVFEVGADGKTAVFEGVEITTASSDGADSWVAALPENPLWSADTGDKKRSAVNAGFVVHSRLVAKGSTDGSRPDEDQVNSDLSNVEYESLDTQAAFENGTTSILYERVGLIDDSWNKMPAAFDPAGADSGQAATDIVTRYPYEDESGYVYERVTATRAKMVRITCDTKNNRVYTLTYNGAGDEGAVDSNEDADGDGEPGTLEDKVLAINAGWSAFASDLAAFGQGIPPSMASDGSKSSNKASAKTASRAARKGIWPFSDSKPEDYANASSKEKLVALSAHARKYGMDDDMTGQTFSGFCQQRFNPDPAYSMNGGIDHRVMNSWGAKGVKDAVESYAGYYQGYVYGYVANVAGLQGWTADIAADVSQRTWGAVKGAYGDATGNDGLDAFVNSLRFEYYQAILAYNKLHPNNPVPWDGFPFGSDLPDPREKKPDKDNDNDPDKPNEGEDPQNDNDPNENESMPNGDGSNQEGQGNATGEGPTNGAANVPNSDSHVGIIDPSGVVYTGAQDNVVEGATATLFEVAADGTRTQWGASEYGQENPYTTDENGHYEWFVPEGKWSVTITKNGYLPYTTGEGDGIGAEQASGTWYMPVAPAQLDVNINLVKAAAPQVKGVEWTKDGIEVTFTQVMDESSLDSAFKLTRNGTAAEVEASYQTVKSDGELVTKATLVPAVEPVSESAYTLEVGASAASDAASYKGVKREGVKMGASYVTAFTPSVEALEASGFEQALIAARSLVNSAEALKVGVQYSADGSEYPPTVTWASHDAFAALDAAIGEFEDAIYDDGATVASLRNATNALNSAMNAFQKACKPGTKKAPVAKPKVVKGKQYVAGKGAAAMYYKVKTVATGKKAGSVWLIKPKAPKKVKSFAVPATVKLADGKVYNVVGISAKAFAKSKALSKLTIGAKVTTVGKAAFKGCKKLKKVTVKSGVLKKASCKSLVKGTKITRVVLKAAAKKAKKKYKKYFPKKNAGKKLIVK